MESTLTLSRTFHNIKAGNEDADGAHTQDPPIETIQVIIQKGSELPTKGCNYVGTWILRIKHRKVSIYNSDRLIIADIHFVCIFELISISTYFINTCNTKWIKYSTLYNIFL